MAADTRDTTVERDAPELDIVPGTAGGYVGDDDDWDESDSPQASEAPSPQRRGRVATYTQLAQAQDAERRRAIYLRGARKLALAGYAAHSDTLSRAARQARSERDACLAEATRLLILRATAALRRAAEKEDQARRAASVWQKRGNARLYDVCHLLTIRAMRRKNHWGNYLDALHRHRVRLFIPIIDDERPTPTRAGE